MGLDEKRAFLREFVIHNFSFLKMGDSPYTDRELWEKAEQVWDAQKSVKEQTGFAVNPKIDTTNHCLVTSINDEIVMNCPSRRMSKKQALVFAAWIVTMADDDAAFTDILHAVMNT